MGIATPEIGLLFVSFESAAGAVGGIGTVLLLFIRDRGAVGIGDTDAVDAVVAEGARGALLVARGAMGIGGAATVDVEAG